MYTINKYIRDTINLGKSIKIKMNDTALAINKNLILNYGYSIETDKTTWKYYLNLAGYKHETNTDITVYSLDTASDIIMDRTIKDTHPLTYNHILTNIDIYEALIYKYPNEKDYIDGMLYPTDIDYIVSVQDGTILYYNTYYIETNEINLIRELNSYIKNIVSRWHIKGYTISDDLYLSALLAIIYSNIITKLFTIRLNNTHTNEVHSFHIEHYFRSKLNLWEDLSVLNKKSLIWVYHNINYILKHQGKESTLDLIIKNIFSSNNIGVGGLVLDIADITVDLDNIDITKPIQETKEPKFISVKYNDEYTNDSDLSRTLASVISSEMNYDNTLDTDILKGYDAYYTKVVENKLDIATIYKQSSKLLDINSYNVFKIDNDVTTQVVIDNFVYYGYTSNSTAIKKFKDPNTLKYYDLTAKQSVNLLFKLLLDMYNSEAKIRHYQYFSILDDTVTLTDVNYNTLSPTDSEYTLEVLINNIPEYPSNLNNPDVFNDYINRVLYYYTVNNILSSNLNNTTVITTVKAANNKIMQRGSIDLTIDNVEYTPTELLLRDDINFEVYGTYDYLATIIELLIVFTGVNIDKYSVLEKYINSFINILNNLTSYTTQVSKNAEDNEPMSTSYTNLNINDTEVGIVTLLDGEITHALEPIYVGVEQTANDFIDILTNFKLEDDVHLERCGVSVSGYAYDPNANSELVVSNEPNISIEVLNTCPIMYTPSIDISDRADTKELNANTMNSNIPTTQSVTYGALGISYDPTTDKELVVSNEPNVTIEILDDEIISYTPNLVTNVTDNDTVNINNIDTNTITSTDETTYEVTYADNITTDETVATNTEPTVTIEVIK